METSSSSITSYKKKKKPCQVCGSNANDDMIMTCFTCKDTREHTYCARVPLSSVPPLWQCEVCHSSFIIVISSETDNSGSPNDSVSSRSSRVDGQNTGSAHSSNQPSESQAQTSPEASSPMSTTNTYPDQKQSDSNTPSDSESAK